MVILYFLLGIVIWQCVTFTVYVLTNDNDDALLWLGAGIPCAFCSVVIAVRANIRWKFFRRRFDYCSFRVKSKPSHFTNLYVEKSILEQFNFDDSLEYYVVRNKLGKTPQYVYEDLKLTAHKFERDGVPGCSRSYLMQFVKE